MAPMAYLAAVEAGAGGLDTAMSPLAWGAGQPATESMVAALAGGEHDTGLDLDRLVEIKLDLDELRGRPLHTQIPSSVLVCVSSVALAGAVALGIAGLSRVGWPLIPFPEGWNAAC